MMGATHISEVTLRGAERAEHPEGQAALRMFILRLKLRAAFLMECLESLRLGAEGFLRFSYLLANVLEGWEARADLILRKTWLKGLRPDKMELTTASAGADLPTRLRSRLGLEEPVVLGLS